MTKPNINTFAPAQAPGKNYRYDFPILEQGNHVIVVGAGAFGGWTALQLLQKKIKVTLIDAWGAGNSRSSSGGETRVIRSTYGANGVYFDLNVRALKLWKEYEKKLNRKIFYNTGVLWFCYDEHNPLIDDSIPFTKKHGMEYRYFTPDELRRHYPGINTDDLHHAYFDPHGGYLKSREACLWINELFVKLGGTYIDAHALPGTLQSGRLEDIRLSNGMTLTADAYVFACGSWLASIFPDVLGNIIQCTKQEIYYFGTSHDTSDLDQLPVWIDLDGQNFYYGIPGNANRGFKIGVDERGDLFDPTQEDRMLNSDTLAKARTFIAHRFPSLKHAPLLENRVCPYENSPDGNFIFDTHPEASNIVLLGGGSGHGFKHGPALGELVTNVLLGKKKAPPLFSLKRFQH